MIGTKWPSEKHTFLDPVSGQPVTQLTDQYLNFHLYFTDNSFDPSCENIYFQSNRCNPESERCQLFRMNLESGEMEQLTDDPAGIMQAQVTKTKDGKLIAYFTGKELRLYNTETRENTLLYEEKGDFILSNLFFSCDSKKIGFTRNEDRDTIPDGGPNYLGFKEKMFAIKDGRVSVINVDGSDFHDVLRDTHWISHFQYSPDDPAIAMFCHEGPWNYVQQRIWVINMETGDFRPCFRQSEEDCVGHEFWSEGGDIIFDNRRDGHDGTISSSGTQVFAEETGSGRTPYFGFAHKDGTVYRKIDMPFYCNHYYANAGLSLFVGDAVKDIVLISIDENGGTKLTTLARHNTTWKYQRSHCHPNFSWDGKKILYSADTDDTHDNIFLVEVPKELL